MSRPDLKLILYIAILINKCDSLAVILLCQIWIVKYFVKYSTVDCIYLLFPQHFFFRLKPKQHKKCQYCRLFKENIWKLIKQNKLFDGIIDVIFDNPYLTE